MCGIGAFLKHFFDLSDLNQLSRRGPDGICVKDGPNYQFVAAVLKIQGILIQILSLHRIKS